MCPRQSAEAVIDAHRVLPEKAAQMVRADLRKPETDDCLAEIGECLDFARRANGWTLDQLAAALPAPKDSDKRDPRQVQRWIEGKERCQVDVVFQVPALRGAFVVALAKLAQCPVEFTIKVSA